MNAWKDRGKKGGEGGIPRLTILVVDDEERILESLAELLGAGYRVLTCGDPEKALEIFRRERPELVLCDQRMPGRTGIEILKDVKSIEPGAIRMLITGYSDIDVVIRALNEETLHRYITKPWENEELLRIVDEAARRYLEESGIARGEPGILF